ncbi:protein FANTASTIC FOUR 1-like [Lycium ferocissimum]|uniref:protein FANTASTIC FOUR 1-like n=1 Tax=Lycium ferocissimum TaxID=112874 RepID=UPI00281590FD|nr:protein FANTASTIC FOUR 1-like [Lycium ferocissimum]
MHRLESSSNQGYGHDLADFIGVESCIDLQADINLESNTQYDGLKIKKRLQMKREKIDKEYPPPIPCLVHTENYPYSKIKMPWVMKRYTEDGRLIIKEEKVKHYEYLEAHRSDGRLTLRLIPLNNEVLRTHDDDDDDDDDDSENELVEDEKEVNIHDWEEKEKEKEEEELSDVNKSDEDSFQQRNGELKGENELANVNGGAVIGTKCCSSCMFDLAMPAIRPLHT